MYKTEIKKERKGDIKYLINLNEEQKDGSRIIRDNQITIVTGNAGTGKSLLCAQVALDLLFKKEVGKIYVTRPVVETGRSMGFLPGKEQEKLNPYLEAFKENLYKCYDEVKINSLLEDDKIKGYSIGFIRGKTVDDILVVEEAANTSKHEMLAILTRLGKFGKIVINGDLFQCDTKDPENGLVYAIELAKHIEGIEHIKLKENHRSDLVGKILNWEYGK